jgi:4-amino-4-deoxy-L-arabinose transferase-like glycosyltransferase
VIPSVPPAAVVLLIRLAWPGPRSLARALFELGLYIVLTVAATLLIERSLMREMWGYLMPERSRRARGAGGPRAKHPWWRTPRAAFFAIVFVALAARLGVAGWAHGLPVIADPADYVRHAVSIAHGHGYPQTAVAFGGPTALRPPAWPYTLGATFAVTHDSIDAARTLQALFGTMAVVLLGLVGRQLWGRRIGLMAMAIGAIYPPWLLLGASLFSEPLFMVLELGALAAALHGRREGGLRWWALCGVLAGLGVLTRANGALLLVPLALLAWTGRPRFGVRALALPALVVAAAALTIVPWTVRNAVTMHAFIPVTTQSGYTLAGAYNDTARHDPREPAAWRVASVDPAYAQLLTDRPGEATLNGRLESKATSYIADHPSYVGTVFLWNLRRFLHLGRYDFARSSYAAYGVPRRAQDIAILSFYPLLLLALLGAVTRAARRAPWPIWLFPLTMLSVLFIEAGMRFRAPIEPFLVLLAAVGLERGLSLIRERWRRPRQLELSADAQPLAGQPAPVP